MMERTVWQPEVASSDDTRRQLSLLIRHAMVNTPEPFAHRSWNADALPHTPVSLRALSWRTLEVSEVQQRTTAQLVFSGQALHGGQRLAFTGHCWRDLPTGSFYEFELVISDILKTKGG